MAHFPALAHRVSWRVFSPFLTNPGRQYTYPPLLYLCMVQKKKKKSHEELSTRAGLAGTLYRPWPSSHQQPFIVVLLFPWSCLVLGGCFPLTEPFGCSLLCACDINHVPIEHGSCHFLPTQQLLPLLSCSLWYALPSQLPTPALEWKPPEHSRRFPERSGHKCIPCV